MNKFKDYLKKLFKQRIIFREDGKPYLIRYYILKTPWFRIRLHNILLSDYDCLHDHPWNFISIILKGGYTEERERVPYPEFYHLRLLPVPLKYALGLYSYRKYRPFSVLFRKAEDKHRLIVNKPAWTLVFMFKRRREWGFWTKNGFTPHEKYNPTQSCE